MKTAFVFPGQGAQFVGMGKDLYESKTEIKDLFTLADNFLGIEISKLMIEGTIEDLTRTDVSQPAIFIHSIATLKNLENYTPNMVAGHSLGEFSALVANECLSFEDGLKLVAVRANAMQKACTKSPGTMAAVLGLEDQIVDDICKSISDEIIVAANYNCPGQIVISGSLKGIELATENLKSAGAKRVLPLKVAGAFHSPLMESAKEELKNAIDKTIFNTPKCPIYQNFNALPFTDSKNIKNNLIDQLTGTVKWTSSVRNMINDGANKFIELGPGNALSTMIKKIDSNVEVLKF